MRLSPRNVLLSLAAVALAVAMAWTLWSGMRPPTSLTLAAGMAEAGRFDEAESVAREYLREKPESSEAHMLLAQIALDRPESEAAKKARRPDPARRSPPSSISSASIRTRPTSRPWSGSSAERRSIAWRGWRKPRLPGSRRSGSIPRFPKPPGASWNCITSRAAANWLRPLALRMHRNEPDPRDRAQFLLELLRQDAQPLAPGSVVQWFEPVLEQNPDDFHANLAMGQNLVREGEADRGLALLERMTREHPDHPDSWDAWLTALDDSGQADLLLKAIESLPGPIGSSPRFAKHHARAAQERSQWPAAVAGYRRSLQNLRSIRRRSTGSLARSATPVQLTRRKCSNGNTAPTRPGSKK